MKKKTRIVGLIILAGITIAVTAGAYLWFKPHRDVQSTEAFATLTVNELTNEFNTDAAKANAKYLSSDGNSKVIIVEGTVNKIITNQAGEKVLILKDGGAKAGVSATFTLETSTKLEKLSIGDNVKIKGAITTGNSYDSDLDLYEDAVIIQCDIVN